MTKLSILVVGKTDSGKSTVCTFISYLTGWQIINIGDLISEFLRGRGLNIEHRAQLGPTLETVGLFDDFMDFLKDRIVNHDHISIFDGVRLPQIEEAITIISNNVEIIYINRPEVNSPRKLLSNNSRRYLQYMTRLYSRSSYIINNKSSIDDLMNQTIDIVNDIEVKLKSIYSI